MAPGDLGAPHPQDALVAQLLERCTFAADGPLEVAVSGGADSTALLALAVAHHAPGQGALGGGVTAHHVDHGLRPGGHIEAAAVRRLCERWGAGFVAHEVVVPDGGDLEARCRDARRAVLPPGVLLGHTADDQAETVLLRLLRGTGPAGVAAMDTRQHPLLALRRADTEALCAHLGVAPFADPSNHDPRFTRNRVRHEVLPLLTDVADRDVVPLLNRFAEQARAQAEVACAQADRLDPTDARVLGTVPGAVAAEALRLWWRDETGLLPPDAAAVQRMLAVVQMRSRSCDVTAGWSLVRSDGRLSLTRDHRVAGR